MQKVKTVRVNREAADELSSWVPVSRPAGGPHASFEVPLWGLQLWSVRSKYEAEHAPSKFLQTWRRISEALSAVGDEAPEYLDAVLSTLGLSGFEAVDVLLSGVGRPGHMTITAPRELAPGVVVRCVPEFTGRGLSRDERLRVRSVSEGYDPDRNVQFPRAVREAGAFFVVDELVPAGGGSHYRTKGRIRPLLEAT